jgi:MoaA/NifB/PqqE/SkfB family radical SAM enzyme
MEILIVTNLVSLTEEVLDILKKLNANPNVYLKVTVSIDGTGKVYDWIRSTPFENTLKNMETYLRHTGSKVLVSSTVSLYTLWTLTETANALIDTNLIGHIIYTYVFLPKYSSYEMIPQNKINQLVNGFFINKAYVENSLFFEKTERLKLLKHTATPVDYNNALRWIDYINKLRGFDIYDYNPQLKEWAENVKSSM